MTNELQHDVETEELMLDDDFVSIAHCHLLASEHYQAAAQHHAKAAEAYEAGNLYETHRRGYMAYRHQLLATQYAEMAAVEDEDDVDFETEDSDHAQD